MAIGYDYFNLPNPEILFQSFAVGLISDKVVQDKYNSSDYDISIEVITLVERNAKQRIINFQQTYPDGYFYVYENGEGEKSFDASLVVILLMAVLTVMVGSFWSGHAKQNLRLKKESESDNAGIREEDPDHILPQDGSGQSCNEYSSKIFGEGR